MPFLGAKARILAALLLAACSALTWPAAAQSRLTPALLSELAGETSERVPEIRRARALAQAERARLAIYGGTSRELLSFIQEKVEKLGSVENYRAWLKRTNTISLYDWHRIASDLDFILIPWEAGTPDQRRTEELRELATTIEHEFPGGVFYSKFDINVAHSFFHDFPAEAEHFEAISNIPITERGVESLPELQAKISGKSYDLASWGLSQYVRGVFDFRRITRTKSDAFGDFRQVLRWIRYMSENPNIKLLESSKEAIRSLLADTLSQHRAEILALLSQGDQDLQKDPKASSRGAKLIQALEKIQIYSMNLGLSGSPHCFSEYSGHAAA